MEIDYPSIKQRSFPMDPHVLIFDLDGTLLDSVEGALDRFVAATQRLGLTITPEQRCLISSHWENGKYELMVRCWPNVDPEDLYREWEALDHMQPHPLYPHVRDVLTKLREYCPVFFLCTHRGAATTKFNLDHHHLTREFSYIDANWDAKEAKHGPEAVARITRELRRVRAQNVTVIGDSLAHDLPLAQELNAQFIASGYGITPPEHFRTHGVPDEHILLDIRELLDIIP